MANPLCKECDGKGYTTMVAHIDGGGTFEVCPCTGIIAESLKRLCDDIVANGPATYSSQEDKSDG